MARLVVMPSLTTTLSFTVATLALILVPGPSVAFVVARSLEHGRVAGMFSVLGLETGAALHVLAAAVGLATLLAAQPLALYALRYGGAAYLVLMGLRKWRAGVADEGRELTRCSRGAMFRAGVLVDLLNPKTALFFVAFLPQFIEPGAGSAGLQILVLGMLFVVLALAVDSSYVLLAHTARERLRPAEKPGRWLQRSTAGVYVGLGGVVALG